MGAADTVSRTVDALLNDWAQIVHLYTIVHDLAEYFKMGMCIARYDLLYKEYALITFYDSMVSSHSREVQFTQHG